jgi:hypothetical protein
VRDPLLLLLEIARRPRPRRGELCGSGRPSGARWHPQQEKPIPQNPNQNKNGRARAQQKPSPQRSRAEDERAAVRRLVLLASCVRR